MVCGNWDPEQKLSPVRSSAELERAELIGVRVLIKTTSQNESNSQAFSQLL